MTGPRPEALTPKPLNAQADIYSFGVVLWELVTKEMPFRGFLRDVHVPEECPQARLRALILAPSLHVVKVPK